MNAPAERIAIDAGGRHFDIEVQWLFAERLGAPLLVFLHEGLGSVAMWRDFPHRLCEAGGFRGLVYSRPGYGRSTPRAPDEKWPVDFMHHQAQHVLPAVLAAAGVDAARDPPWLFGHSDGASIALIHAALFPRAVAGAVVLAPHLFVEALSVRSIAAARDTYLHTDLRSRLARHHDDVDSAFWGWNDIWLDPAFRHWTIAPLMADIRCPVLAVQGERDEFGTMAQIDAIAHGAPQTRLLKLADCGHSPHRDQAEAVIEATVDFVRQASRPAR
ncbi:MAG: alpha/beta fold hydrolase [Panacagrimonas sp.]